MRIEIVLIIVALVILGGLGVDEYYLRQDYAALQTQVRQAETKHTADTEQITQLKIALQSTQAQAVQCEKDKTNLANRIDQLNNQKCDQQPLVLSSPQAAPLTYSRSIRNFSAGGLLAFLATAGGVLTVKKIRHTQAKRSHPSRNHPQNLTMRVTQKELDQLIDQRRGINK